MMGSILSQNSSDTKGKDEDSTLIEMISSQGKGTTADEYRRSELDSVGDDDVELADLKMNQCRIANCPTDPNAHQFVKTFRELQGKKEHFYVQLHNEVIQWRLMFQRGVSNKFENNDKVNKLIGEFITIHETLDDFLEEERKNIDKILPKRKALNDASDGQKKSKKDSLIQGERESLELTPEAMQRLMCFQQCNDQHIRILTQVLSDIEDCKKFESAKIKQETKEVQPAPSNKPVSITVSSVDSEEFGIQSAESHS